METSRIAANLQAVLERIRRAAESCSRDPAEIRLLAVSKTFQADRIEEAVQAGQRFFGENRVQEAFAKAPLLAGRGIAWHLIGPLQSNKVRKAVEVFDVIETVHSFKLAERISRLALETGKVQEVYLQVNIGREPQKSGAPPEEVGQLAQRIEGLQGLRLAGLMAIPPYLRDPEASRAYFRSLAQLRAQAEQSSGVGLPGLSMGMSHDFEAAIEEGATLVRVGTAIFGPRRPPNANPA